MSAPIPPGRSDTRNEGSTNMTDSPTVHVDVIDGPESDEAFASEAEASESGQDNTVLTLLPVQNIEDNSAPPALVTKAAGSRAAAADSSTAGAPAPTRSVAAREAE